MKVAFISDIHINVSSAFPVLETLLTVVKENEADLLLIAGDISENYAETIAAVNSLNKVVKTLYVPGNHDLWRVEGEDKSNVDIYHIYSSDSNCLVNNSILIEDVVFIGDAGWYDYSLASKDYSLDELDKMSINGRTWQDKIKNSFTKDNVRVCEYMLNKLEAQLIKYESVKKKVVLTHMLPIKEFCVPDSIQDWSYFNAFLGSIRFKELFDRYSVTLSVSGHVHYRKSTVINKTTYICPCLGYGREWKLTDVDENDVRAQIEDAIIFYEL